MYNKPKPGAPRENRSVQRRLAITAAAIAFLASTAFPTRAETASLTIDEEARVEGEAPSGVPAIRHSTPGANPVTARVELDKGAAPRHGSLLPASETAAAARAAVEIRPLPADHLELSGRRIADAWDGIEGSGSSAFGGLAAATAGAEAHACGAVEGQAHWTACSADASDVSWPDDLHGIYQKVARLLDRINELRGDDSGPHGPGFYTSFRPSGSPAGLGPARLFRAGSDAIALLGSAWTAAPASNDVAGRNQVEASFALPTVADPALDKAVESVAREAAAASLASHLPTAIEVSVAASVEVKIASWTAAEDAGRLSTEPLAARDSGDAGKIAPLGGAREDLVGVPTAAAWHASSSQDAPASPAHATASARVAVAPPGAELLPMLLLTPLLALPFLVLYRRVRKEQALDHALRKQILDRVASTPGTTPAEIQRGLGVHYTTCRHHLRILQGLGIVELSRVGGRVRCFDARDGLGEREVRLFAAVRNRKSRRILRALLQAPGSGPSQLARALGTSPSALQYHLDRLQAWGLLETSAESGRIALRVTPQAAGALVDLVAK